jgi:hypothetical protein
MGRGIAVDHKARVFAAAPATAGVDIAGTWQAIGHSWPILVLIVLHK